MGKDGQQQWRGGGYEAESLALPPPSSLPPPPPPPLPSSPSPSAACNLCSSHFQVCSSTQYCWEINWDGCTAAKWQLCHSSQFLSLFSNYSQVLSCGSEPKFRHRRLEILIYIYMFCEYPQLDILKISIVGFHQYCYVTQTPQLHPRTGLDRKNCIRMWDLQPRNF